VGKLSEHDFINWQYELVRICQSPTKSSNATPEQKMTAYQAVKGK
jgi:hypothetical protein